MSFPSKTPIIVQLIMIISKMEMSPTINNFTNDNADGRGGDLPAEGNSSFNLTIRIFSGISTQFDGVMNATGSSFNISNNTFADNSAGSNGGVMASWTSSFMIHNNAFTDNSAARFGGVIATSESSVNISHNTLVKNSAAYFGGVIYYAQYSTFNVSNCTFLQNNPTSYGGVIHMLLFSFINIIDSHLSNNGAQFYGGIMYMSQSFPRFLIVPSVIM